MDTITLTVSKRSTEERANNLRKEGLVPGVMYGNKMPNTSIKCMKQDLKKAFVKAGESTLVNVQLDEQSIPCLIHAVAFEPVSGAFEHVDLYAVDMMKKVTTHVPVVFVGESLAVKDLGGVLVEVNDHVTVTCLPKDLPHNFTVDISSLAAFRDTITIATLVIPNGVTIDQEPDTVLITVQEPRKEEEIAPPVTAQTAEGEEATATTDTPAAGAGASNAGVTSK